MFNQDNESEVAWAKTDKFNKKSKKCDGIMEN